MRDLSHIPNIQSHLKDWLSFSPETSLLCNDERMGDDIHVFCLSLSWKKTWNDSSAQSTPSLSYIFVAVMSFLLTPVFMAGDGLPCERMSDTKTAKWRWSSSLSFTDSIKSWEKRKEARETRRERSRQTLDINCIASLDRQDPVHERETGRRERERNQDKREEGLP